MLCRPNNYFLNLGHTSIYEIENRGTIERTLVSIFAGDVEAALDPQGTDPDEGVSSGRGEAVVLLARVVVPDNKHRPCCWDTGTPTSSCRAPTRSSHTRHCQD